MTYTEKFNKLSTAQQLAAFANKHCQGRMISFLEGGYNLKHLAGSVVAYLGASTYPPLPLAGEGWGEGE